MANSSAVNLPSAKRRALPNSLSQWAELAGVAACIVAFASFSIQLHDSTRAAKERSYKPAEKQSSKSATKIDNTPITLTCPTEGKSVMVRALVSGATDLPRGFHFYILVTAPDGTSHVQSAPMTFSGNGDLSGYAAFGKKDVGSGEIYVLSIFATSTDIPPRDRQVPPGAVFSNSIRVKRI